VRALVRGGERQNCPKLSIAGLDLLGLLHSRLESLMEGSAARNSIEMPMVAREEEDLGGVLVTCWLPVLEGMADAARKSRYPSVRQHALSMLTDAIIDRHGRDVPKDELCGILDRICIPLAGSRMVDLLRSGTDPAEHHHHVEEIMIELELCISLIFKPFLHHLRTLLTMREEFVAIWMSMLGVMTELLGEEVVRPTHGGTEGDDYPGGHAMTRDKLLLTTKELGSEHLRNAIMVLVASGVLRGEGQTSSGDGGGFARGGGEDVSALTWNAIGRMKFCRQYVEEWKQSASAEGGEAGTSEG